MKPQLSNWFDAPIPRRRNSHSAPMNGFFHVERGQGGVGAFTSSQIGAVGTALFIANPISGLGSVLELDCATNTDGNGIQVQYPGLGVNPKDGMIICWETMVQLKDIATTGPELFLGMATLGTGLITSDAYNMALSDRRSKAVFDYLTSRGVDPARLDRKSVV